MNQIIAATFQAGVFKPDEQPALPENTRVRLAVEAINEDSDQARRQQGWADLQQLWQESKFDSGGDRLNRDQLHERR